MSEHKISVSFTHQFDSNFLINLEFETTSLVTGLFGPSGSGKSSILNFMSGIKSPQKGVFKINNDTFLDTDSKINIPIDKRLIGYVFQDNLLFPHLNIEKNLKYGIKKNLAKFKVNYELVCDILELNSLLNLYPANLSGGQKKRVALGRAILSSPKLLLLDEPLVGLDEELKNKVYDYLVSVINTFRIPTIYVCHDLAEITNIAGSIIRINKGRLEGINLISQDRKENSLEMVSNLQ